jgi:hypothetical protein
MTRCKHSAKSSSSQCLTFAMSGMLYLRTTIFEEFPPSRREISPNGQWRRGPVMVLITSVRAKSAFPRQRCMATTCRIFNDVSNR